MPGRRPSRCRCAGAWAAPCAMHSISHAPAGRACWPHLQPAFRPALFAAVTRARAPLPLAFPHPLPTMHPAAHPCPLTSFSARSLSTWPLFRNTTNRLFPLKGRPVMGHANWMPPSSPPPPLPLPAAASNLSSTRCFRPDMWARDFGSDFVSSACRRRASPAQRRQRSQRHLGEMPPGWRRRATIEGQWQQAQAAPVCSTAPLLFKPGTHWG